MTACKRALPALWVLSSGKDRALRAAGGLRVKRQSQKAERYDKFQKNSPKAPSNAVSMVMSVGPFLRVRKFSFQCTGWFFLLAFKRDPGTSLAFVFQTFTFYFIIPPSILFLLLDYFWLSCLLFSLLPSSCFIFNFLSRILSPFP